MKLLAFLLVCILCAMLIVVFVGGIGAALSGECDMRGVGVPGDGLNACTESGFDVLNSLLGATPAPGR